VPARYSKHIGFFNGLIDFALITAVYIVSERYPISHGSLNMIKLFLLYISFFLAIILYRPYRSSRTSSLFMYVRTHISFLSIQIFITIFAVLAIDINIRNIGAFFRMYAAALVTLFIYRLVYYMLLKWYRKKGFNFRSVVIVGYGKTAIELSNSFKNHPEYGYRFLDYFTEVQEEKDKAQMLKGLYSYCNAHSVDEIFCCIPFVSNNNIEKIIEFAEEHHIKVNITTDFRGYSNRYFDLDKIKNIPVINISHSPLEQPVNKSLKRSFDFVFSSFFIVLLFLPLYFIVGLLIKLDSKGNILFKQVRTGVKNSEFTCLKFRTMVVNKQSNLAQASTNDPRVTRIGKFLRKTSLDEVPQLINVFKGEMSIIGPRPHMISHTEKYSGEIKQFMARHYILPGMTGLAQVKGCRGEIKNKFDISSRLKYDKFYIQHWSFFLDAQIFFKTIRIIFKGDKNAY